MSSEREFGEWSWQEGEQTKAAFHWGVRDVPECTHLVKEKKKPKNLKKWSWFQKEKKSSLSFQLAAVFLKESVDLAKFKKKVKVEKKWRKVANRGKGKELFQKDPLNERDMEIPGKVSKKEQFLLLASVRPLMPFIYSC